MGLLDLVEQHDRVGLSTDSLGQLSHLRHDLRIPGGDPMSFETACFSMYSLMSNRTKRLLTAEEELS